MNKEEFIEKIMMYDGYDCVEFELEDGSIYSIEDGANFIGGSEGTYESTLLGHIAYDSYESCVNAVADYIYDEISEIVINVDC